MTAVIYQLGEAQRQRAITSQANCMMLIPAVDILAGKCVRLFQGNYKQITPFGEPLAAAKRWEREGAELLHVVDLDGARSGRMKNFGKITGIIRSVKIPVQVGGGIRDRETAGKLLSAGAARIVIGTKAIENPEFLRALPREKVVVALDCIGGRIAKDGWVRRSTLPLASAVKKFEKTAGRFLLTSIPRDGTLGGVDLKAIEKLVKTTSLPVIASGGASSLEDVKKVAAAGAEALIVGRALYENKFTLNEAMACLQKE